MRIIMGLFSKLSALEKQLEKEFIKELQSRIGMSPSEAKRTFLSFLSRAKKASKEGGTSHLPPNFGDILIEKEEYDEQTMSLLAKRRKEGVVDEDIKWWWNMYEIERRLILEMDFFNRYYLMKKHIDDGIEEKESVQLIRKSFIIYGDPEDDEHTTGDDKPIPHELMKRIGTYLTEKMQEDPEKHLIETGDSSTLNAFARKKIREGEI
jgi:hypothetical protein